MDDYRPCPKCGGLISSNEICPYCAASSADSQDKMEIKDVEEDVINRPANKVFRKLFILVLILFGIAWYFVSDCHYHAQCVGSKHNTGFMSKLIAIPTGCWVLILSHTTSAHKKKMHKKNHIILSAIGSLGFTGCNFLIVNSRPYMSTLEGELLNTQGFLKSFYIFNICFFFLGLVYAIFYERIKLDKEH